ncbi:MAG: hypothetical protein RR645_05570 [Clostridium sp.]
MISPGIVSYADNIMRIATIYLPDKQSVTFKLTVAEHVGNLVPGQTVVIGFYGQDSLTDGVVLGKVGNI